jgi:hypothetical protein
MKYLHDPVESTDREDGFAPVPAQSLAHILIAIGIHVVITGVSCALETYHPCDYSCSCVSHVDTCPDYADCCLGISPVH